jgi:hypothetical protein
VVLPPLEEETTMQIHYGPRGLHAELTSGFDRLITARRRMRRIRPVGARGSADGASAARH